ncbi:MAG TPA: 50S ribosomal protein L17 [Candidatus Paceibacterota bacterium]|jgi:large subunit ribosomal protein L17|nr:50S ribosomal protein L17 [Parcubacteria group bacterium]MDP6119677.1 50S ribosomal protein L17 [Candidatus Paceibacterota bacterium]HJN62775.1 50S ribosomal protein L17 [Candidatus Paceibacterota bacterium]|tara:strand:+ start:595 stop:939 length:345 start_codon:yes stop_codon:yes gene_type:complete
MKHQKVGRKFGRKTNQREALMRSLALSLINEGKIKTSLAKAKELRPYVEKIVTKAKINSVTSRRAVKSKLGADNKNLFDKVAPTYKDRSGGYTRITKLGNRASDGSQTALIEFV